MTIKRDKAIEEAYVKRLRQSRTTIFTMIKLYLKKRISFSYLKERINKAQEIYLTDEYGKEEMLSTKAGLEMIGEERYVTWDGYVVSLETPLEFPVNNRKTMRKIN